MSRILAIDPGPEQSAWVTLDTDLPEPLGADIAPNHALLRAFPHFRGAYGCEHLAIEMVASYGMAVGRTIFETCVWVGRFIEAWGGPHTKVYRRDVKLHLCNSARAKDANVRQALIDRYPASGGGKVPQIGTKAKPGPLYGFRKDIWAALGVAVTWAESSAPYHQDGPLRECQRRKAAVAPCRQSPTERPGSTAAERAGQRASV